MVQEISWRAIFFLAIPSGMAAKSMAALGQLLSRYVRMHAYADCFLLLSIAFLLAIIPAFLIRERATRQPAVSTGVTKQPQAVAVGSPQQIIDKVHRYHEQLGHGVLHIPADGAGLTRQQHWATLELFQSAIAPVLRRAIPSRPFPAALVCMTAPVTHE